MSTERTDTDNASDKDKNSKIKPGPERTKRVRDEINSWDLGPEEEDTKEKPKNNYSWLRDRPIVQDKVKSQKNNKKDNTPRKHKKRQ